MATLRQHYKDFLLLFFGCAGIVWFYADFGNNYAPSTISINTDNTKIVQAADSIFASWNNTSFKSPRVVKLAENEVNPDSLHSRYENRELVKIISSRKQAGKPGLPIYVNTVSVGGNQFGGQNEAKLSFSESGELVGFELSPEVIKSQNLYNRNLLLGEFERDFGSPVSDEVADTLIAGMLDFQHMRQNMRDSGELSSLLMRLSGGRSFTIRGYMTADIIWRNAQYYIDNSFWRQFEFSRDSLSIDDKDGYVVSRLVLTATDEVLGIRPRLEMELLPAGSLGKMKASYFNEAVTEKDAPVFDRSNLIRQVFVLLFAIWTLIVFYFRIKARAIDTKPALLMAVIAGFLVPAFIVLRLFKTLSLNEFSFDSNFANQLFVLGVIGALTSVGFFLITSVSDSITRQYWPGKLRTWDLVRQGMFKNKPVGRAIIRGFSIGGVLAGLLILGITVIPGVYLGGSVSFAAEDYLFGAIVRQLMNLSFAIVITVPVFLISANFIYGKWQRKWLIPVLTGIVAMFIEFVFIDIQPELAGFAFCFVMGFVLGLFYLKFDFVTLALGYFVYLGIINTVNGWTITGSPDLITFYTFIGLAAALFIVGAVFVFQSEETDKLPDYVPEYLEEQAKEQRVQQELDIARAVQYAFLPNITPRIKGIDVAAFCEPAMDAGGDYYDIISIDEGKSGIAVGDVSGKGIRAAFYMTFIKGVIHSLSGILSSPKELLAQANRLFNYNATRGTFITMIYGVLDSEKRTFTYVRAGHNPILYKQHSGKTQWLRPKGLALGLAKEAKFLKESEEVTIPLEKGDTLILFTDGVNEAQDKYGRFYGDEKLFNLIQNENLEKSSDLLKLILQDVKDFYGDATQYDDMTLIVIKV